MSTRSLKSALAFEFQITSGVVNAAQTPINLSPNLEKIEGYYAGGAAAWLQFYDHIGHPADAVTNWLREVQIVPTNGFLWQYIDDTLRFNNLINGLVVCISTTQGALTLATGGNQSTFEVELEEWELPYMGGKALQIAGDNTTACKSLQAWADGTANTLIELDVTNSTAGDIYAQVFCQDAPVNTDLPFQSYLIPTTGKRIVFGSNGGLIPTSITSPTLVKHTGCTIWFSTTQNTLTKVVANSGTIQAKYA